MVAGAERQYNVEESGKMSEMVLWYESPAKRWEESLPIGNGSLGAMIMGTCGEEVLGLNEESLWSGFYRDKNNPEAYAALQDVRRLMFAGEREQAEERIRRSMLGAYNESYLPMGNLHIRFSHGEQVQEYRRQLDLENALAQVSYRAEGISYEREYFASYPAKAIFVRLKASKQALDCRISFTLQQKCRCRAKEGALEINGKCPEHVEPSYVPLREQSVIQGERGMDWQAKVSVLACDGMVRGDGDALLVKHAGSCLLMISAVKEAVPEENAGYEKIRQAHVADYRKLYDRVELFLGKQPDVPTDRRLAAVKDGGEDNGLYALLFQYGRYLLIASSRKGSLPANLQGIWSWELRAPWSCNWTVNINTQMNYWHALSCGLEECLEPYIRFVERVCEEGQKTARINYHCRGFVSHHNIDYWGNTSPVGLLADADEGGEGCVSWAFWPMSGPWLIQELYRAWEYHPDEAFLREVVYPVTRQAALFLCDWLVEKDGQYVTCPSTSPENRYFYKGKKSLAVTMASALDLSLIREVFSHFRTICETLGLEDALLLEIAEKEEKLAPFGIGSRGQLLEWDGEYDEPEPGHRHVSHLYGLFPSELFERDDRMKAACRISLEERLANGGGHTGWSCAWIINLFAILGDGERVWEYLRTLMIRSTYPNLWDAHPPFQIDGNFGATAGIANMLVQDRGGCVKLLPALPKQFSEGYVKGLCIKDNKKVDLEWKDGVIVHERIYACGR